MNYVANFFAGAFLCNCIPHLVSGLLGMPFPTPFAHPRGVGNSSPVVNFLWGFSNFLAGGFLLWRQPVAFGTGASGWVMVAGAVCLGLHLSIHFGKVRSQSGGLS
jgi:hypothetical protein